MRAALLAIAAGTFLFGATALAVQESSDPDNDNPPRIEGIQRFEAVRVQPVMTARQPAPQTTQQQTPSQSGSVFRQAPAGLQPARQSAGTGQLSDERLAEAASMASLNADSVRSAVSQSPLFLAELDYRGLSAATALNLTIADGAQIDLPLYLRETDLSAEPAIAAVLANPQSLGVIGRPDQRNEVFLLEDRLVVSRQLTVRVPRDACSAPRNDAAGRQFQNEFCLQFVPSGQRTDFARVPGGTTLQPDDIIGAPPTNADLREEAEALRAELRAMNPRAIYSHDVTVAEALRLNDDALMALELNGEEREVTHVTVIPLDETMRVPGPLRPDLLTAPPSRLPDGLQMNAPVGPAIRVIPDVFRQHVLTRADLMPDRRIRGGMRLPDEALNNGRPAAMPTFEEGFQVFTMPQSVTAQGVIDPEIANRLRGFDPRQAVITTNETFYFLTGFTISRSIEDRYKRTFNKRKNYYVAFEYSVGFGLGLRFPFEVQTSSTEFMIEMNPDEWRTQSLSVALSARGVSGAERVPGVPSVYLASGLDPSLRFDDQEFVFRLWARCRLSVRAPVVKTVRVNCPSVDIPRAGTCPDWACQRFTPPIHAGNRELGRVTLPARVTGLRINAWIAEAGLEPGVRLESRNSTLSFNFAANGAQFDAEGGLSCRSTSRGSPTTRNTAISPQRCSLEFFRAGHESNNRMNFRMNGLPGRDATAILSDPVYDFTLALIPFIDLYAAIDIWLARWELRHTFDIPGLTITQDFTFPRHDGTRQNVVFGQCDPNRRNVEACRNASIRIQERTRGPG
ncbi:MAG: hypothetical protein ACQRW7_14275 [Caulobacterales bacterium]|uniref:hypothetical protein n=1 Tax=Glycocaulis sp. TaxID=1969725 RepID=UPI003F9F18CB